MRPVNLIPVEERRGASRAPAGTTGNGIYALLGVLGVLLLGALLVVLQGNKINNQKSELAKLKAENEEAVQQAEKSGSALPDTAFEAAAQARFDVIHQTAAQRFNFQRRVRQLTRAVPNTVKLMKLSAALGGGDAGGTADAGGGDPNFAMSFCIVKEDRWQQLAETMTRMRNLDGVTRVEVDASTNPEKAADGGGASSGGGAADASSPCPADEFTSGITVHFKAKTAAAGSPAEAAPAGGGPKNAVQQAQGASAVSDATNSASGADSSSSSGSGSAPGGSP